jgi:hypothetical protein
MCLQLARTLCATMELNRVRREEDPQEEGQHSGRLTESADASNGSSSSPISPRAARTASGPRRGAT